jgi:serine/threonine-protein kinase
LGAVFVALDTELHREVALKQILDAHADDPVSRQRFLLEAEITGGLEHPGVVPVYGLGTYADGRPYYAMRFVRGDSLKEAIEAFHAEEGLKSDLGRRSLELRKLLHHFLDVCNAIEYAHSRGVLHRDIKPGNMIIGRYGETLVVDWGLAKARGHADADLMDERPLVPSSASGSAETLPGSTLGTPAYMSPEQARGDLEHLGPQSDVYSLGATLYCLLTGKPPVEHEDMGQVLRAVQRGEFSPPRRIDPTIDPALEAVCLKAMALRPGDRYPGPKALAEDVERWMADEPVTARRESLGVRIRRWTQRKRSTVAAIVATVLVAVIGLSAVLIVQARANSRLRESNASLEIANARVTKANADLNSANERERRRFDLALEAIQKYHTGVSQDVLLRQGALKSLRGRLLNDAAQFYRKLEGMLSDQADRHSRRALGQAYNAIAELTYHTGSPGDALAAHHRAHSLRRALASEPGADAETRADLGETLLAIGWLHSEKGQNAEALASYEEARDLLEDLTRSRPRAAAVLYQLGQCYNVIGIQMERMNMPTEALAAHERALAVRRNLVDLNPSIAQYRGDFAFTQRGIGTLLARAGRLTEARAAYEQALAILQKAGELQSDDAQDQMTRWSLRGGLYKDYGLLLFRLGQPIEAKVALERGAEILRRMVEDNPTEIDIRAELGSTYMSLGYLLSQTGVLTEAMAAYEKARAIYKDLADANPTVIRFREPLARTLVNTGWILSKQGKPAEAMAEYERSAAIYRELADGNPTVTWFQEQLASDLRLIGEILSRQGKLTEAMASFERAMAIHQRLAEVKPDVPTLRRNLASISSMIGITQRRGGRAAEAAKSFRRAIATMERLPAESPVWVYDLACYHALLAGLASDAGSGLSEAEGRAEADRAMEALRRAVASGYRNLAHMRTDTDLDSLQPRPDFQLLLMDLAFPSEPLADGR